VLATLRRQRPAEEGDDVHGVLERARAVPAAHKPMSASQPGSPGPAGELPVIDGRPGPGRGPARRRWFSVVGVTAALALLAGGVITLVPRHRHTVTQLAADCGLVNCGATLPGAIVTSSPSGQISTARPHHKARMWHRVTPALAATPPAPTPAKPKPTPAKPPPGPDVGVTYIIDSQDNHWGQNHFHSHLAIVNHGNRPVSNWTIQLTLPGDGIRWVWYQVGWSQQPFSSWGFSGATLTLTASSPGETLAPGASQTVYIDGDGNAASPSGCSFDGVACHS
jgi:hypothetical protein